jgi:hydrogenase/urease accessory protein HupE
VGVRHVRALIVALLFALPAIAHEIGTTQVTARFNRDHTYEVDVVTGPASLLSKIEHHRVAPGPDVHARLAAHTRELADAAEIRFGNVRVSPEIAILPNDTIRFHGDIPRNAGAFSWRWQLTYSAYSLAIGPHTEWLDGDSTSAPFPLSSDLLPPSRLDVIRQYLILGFTHIVPYGFDHILFVLGIFLLTTKLRPMLAQVTAFTIAHSITLGLTIYGIVSVSPRIVEPAIALSIAYVAIENVVTSELKPWRVAIVFGFGLLHGMGFAGVLREMGLPRSEFLTALVTFNVGVECGQLAVIASAFGLVAYWHRTKPWYRGRFVVPASMAIAAAGLFWTVQRLL